MWYVQFLLTCDNISGWSRQSLSGSQAKQNVTWMRRRQKLFCNFKYLLKKMKLSLTGSERVSWRERRRRTRRWKESRTPLWWRLTRPWGWWRWKWTAFFFFLLSRFWADTNLPPKVEIKCLWGDESLRTFNFCYFNYFLFQGGIWSNRVYLGYYSRA